MGKKSKTQTKCKTKNAHGRPGQAEEMENTEKSSKENLREKREIQRYYYELLLDFAQKIARRRSSDCFKPERDRRAKF